MEYQEYWGGGAFDFTYDFTTTREGLFAVHVAKYDHQGNHQTA